MERTTRWTRKITVAEDNDAADLRGIVGFTNCPVLVATEKDDMDNYLLSEPKPKINYAVKAVGGSLTAISGISHMMIDAGQVTSHTAVIAVKRRNHIILGMDSLTCTCLPDGSYEHDDEYYDKSILLYDTVFLGGCGDSLGAFDVLKGIIPERLAEMLPRKPRNMLIIADTLTFILNDICRRINFRPPPSHVSLVLAGICTDGAGIFTIESDGEQFRHERRDRDDVEEFDIAGGSGSDAMRQYLEENPFQAHFTETEAIDHTRKTLEHAIEETEDCGGPIRVFSIVPGGHTLHTW